MGVVLGDEPRVQRARREMLADTSGASRNASRSLTGLWLDRANAASGAGADTLRAATEDAMRDGAFLFSAEAIDRLVIARALRRRGTPAEAERYLMWTDAATNVTRSMAPRIALSPLVSYERGVALDEAGDRKAAAYRLRRFLDEYDQPPPAHRGLVEDAQKRLAAMETKDAPRAQPVAPR
jgi:hypothetical protein